MRNRIPFVFLVSAILSAFLAPHAEAVPPVPATGLKVQITESGKISLSADGSGSNAVSSTIEVNKPNAAATVRSAFFACASNFNRVINDGDVSLDGNPITWAVSVLNNADPSFPNFLNFFNNVFSNVTAIVKPKADAAVPGFVDFIQTELNTGSIDGCALYVVFDDPSQTTDNTVFIFFGGQKTSGDNFSVTLAQPLSGSDRAEMGLGISFSFQGSIQFSQIDVNSVRLTTSAGGQDDGAAAGGDGRLLTVGGIGDSTANPANPNAQPAGDPRIDDELYDLRPFVGPSATSILVQTLNPSDDDNIFTGHFFVTKPAIVGEGIVLAPPTSTNPVGTQHTVTARVVNTLGQPASGRVVDFQVISGPNAGTSNSGTTNANGEASFTYTGTDSAGTDVIDASFIDSTGVRQTSNQVQKTWVLDVVVPPPNPQVSCRSGKPTCSVPLTCPLSPAQGVSCIGEVRVLVARRFLPRTTARSSADTVAKARRRTILFSRGNANIPSGVTQDVRLRLTRGGKRIRRSGVRRIMGVMEISNAGTISSRTRVPIRFRRR